jgi:hypothetical protein
MARALRAKESVSWRDVAQLCDWLADLTDEHAGEDGPPVPPTSTSETSGNGDAPNGSNQ